jgi:hypothetical protein
MHTVVETPAYLASAKEEGMTEAEMKAAVDVIAANPKTGDLIVGSGGCRKVRVAGRGKGKSGGYRIVTYYRGDDMPVFFLAVLAKGSRANFSKAERNAMAKVTKTIAGGVGGKVPDRRGR